MEPLALHKESSVAIYGTGEFAELVYLGLREIGIEEIDIFGPNASSGVCFLGLPVKNIYEMTPDKYDRVVVATFDELESVRSELRDHGTAPDKVVTFFADGTTKEYGR